MLLGSSILKSNLCKKYKLIKPTETIRATVVGAGTHTTEISGSTITYTADALPLKNMPVLKLTDEDEDDFENAISKKLKWFEGENVALSFKMTKPATFLNVLKYAESILNSAGNLNPIVVVTEKDVAKALGQTLQSKTKMSVVCIDSVKLSEGDYIDIGRPIAGGMAVPVVIKTLVFS